MQMMTRIQVTEKIHAQQQKHPGNENAPDDCVGFALSKSTPSIRPPTRQVQPAVLSGVPFDETQECLASEPLKIKEGGRHQKSCAGKNQSVQKLVAGHFHVDKCEHRSPDAGNKAMPNHGAQE